MLVLFEGEFGTRDTLRYIEEKLGVGLFIWELATNTLHWSNGTFILYGLAPGSVQPSLDLVQELTYPEDRWTAGVLETKISQGQRLDWKFRVILRNGRMRWLATRAEVLMGPDGKPTRVVGTITDVTKDHELDSRIEFVEQRRQALVKAVHGIGWTAEPDGKILESTELKNRRAICPPGIRSMPGAAGSIWTIAPHRSRPGRAASR